MKRALLIAGGTVGGIGAVLSITPPQLGLGGALGIASASASTSLPVASATPASNSEVATTSSTSNAAAAVTQTKKATPKATVKSNKSTTNKVATPTGSTSTTTNSSVTGSFTGDAVDVGYGIVQVKITVAAGKITEATAIQSPTGRSQRFSDYALPNLRQQTLTIQSAAIQGVSGASYTSYGWYKSLISALTKAGLKTGV